MLKTFFCFVTKKKRIEPVVSEIEKSNIMFFWACMFLLLKYVLIEMTNKHLDRIITN